MTTTRHLLRLTQITALGVGLRLASGCAHTHATPPPPAAVPPTKPEREQAVETGLPISSTSHGILRDGAELKIQQRLAEKGFLDGHPTSGQLDPQTRAALRKFQKHEGLPPTGLPSYETVRHLRLDLDSIFQTVSHPREPPAASSG
ncbi:MAG TPA: peptidoglycan-binding domain-containing protein [Polyangia bacterium]|nr:peptidoglycan-binding domain-containing protein [Polyangia bacterium]